MAFSQILKRTQKATIPITELFDLNDSLGTTQGASVISGARTPSTSQAAGSESPFVKINDVVIQSIENLIIDETGFIPTLTLIFKDINGGFAGPAFPKKKLLASIYIKSSNDNLFSIRTDFLITSIKSLTKPAENNGRGLSGEVVYLVKGELFVPNIYNNTSKSYKSVTSKDTLINVASELGLGFVENEVITSDAMTWINMNSSPLNFIKDVAGHAYGGDESFFDTYISKELNLCMIEVSRQLAPLELDETFISLSDSRELDYNQAIKESANKSVSDEKTMVKILTSDPGMASMSNYILEANLISNQGKILKDNGYKKKIYYYDHALNDDPINKFQDFFMAPINTIGAPEEHMLIPEDLGMDEVGVKKWMDINYGNTHSQWNAARLLNTHNLNELEKIQLRVVTRGINPQTIKGDSIFTYITQFVAEYLKAGREVGTDSQSGTNSLNRTDIMADQQLSGRYYVKGVRYHYDALKSEPFSTEFFLARREWRPSKIIY
jgi:hypothetical protein